MKVQPSFFRPPGSLFSKETPAIKVVVVYRSFDIIVQFGFLLRVRDSANAPRVTQPSPNC